MFDEPGFRGASDWESAETTLQTFVYCSRAADGVNDIAVNRIVEFSQRRNVARGITGVLVFGSGVFFQWIEGPPVEVEKLIANLHDDARHNDVVALDLSVEKRERLYPGWEMELVEADDIRTVLHDALECAEDDSNIAALKRILQHLDTEPLSSLGRG